MSINKQSFIVAFGTWLVYLFFQAQGISAGDSGDLVTAAATFGVPHPPGYPLYTFIGYVLTSLPFFTPAWRVGLLSSLPHAIVLGLVYWLLRVVLKRVAPALFAVLFLGGNYLYFLYSVTPEVFALLDLFLIILIILCFRWSRDGDRKWLVTIAFIFGLSLTHHHLILFFVPAIGLWFYLHRQLLKKNFKKTKLNAFLVFGFICGLLPYIYVFFAAHSTSLINWDRVTTWSRFVQLLTRADYGTFTSGAVYGTLLVERILQLKMFGNFVWIDLQLVGVLLSLAGLYWFWTKERKIFYFFTVALVLLGPLFFFYASFPLANRFTLGTYERFLLPSYLLFSIFIGAGLHQVLLIAERVTRRISTLPVGAWSLGLFIVFCLYPLSLGTITMWRFYGLAHDKTAENFAKDILDPLPPNSILLLGRDTTLFTTQYVRYATGYRKDIFLLQIGRLGLDDYKEVVHAAYPQLIVPTGNGDSGVKPFIEKNIKYHPIFSNTQFPVGDKLSWVPHGLVFQAVDEANLPQVDAMFTKNKKIWTTFHNPNNGILSRYNHLMLSDVLDVYVEARMNLGKVLLRANEIEKAKEQFTAAITYKGDTETENAYTYEGLSKMFLKDCNGALSSFNKAQEFAYLPSKEVIFYKSITYRDCVGDDKKAKELFDEYEVLRLKEEVPL